MSGGGLAGRVALVTGASGGIGRAISLELAGRGARVWAHFHRNLKAAEETVGQLVGDSHRVVQADLHDPEAIRALVDEVVAESGRLDILVNNAGIFERHPIAEIGYGEWQDHWRRTLETNLVGPANLCYCAAHHMLHQKRGKIINISSRGAFRGEPESPAYGASKAGLNALSQSLAKALGGSGIYVYAVAPGFVETAMVRDYVTGELAESIKQQSPLGRVATPRDVAYWVGCMAEDGADFATGTIVDVNGASYLRT